MDDRPKTADETIALLDAALRLDAAVSHMAEGLCMFDGERRLVVSNQKYADIYGLPPELVEPGTPHAEIVAYRVAHGMEPFEQGADFQKRHEELIKQMKPASENVQLKNGRIIRIAHQSLPIGGWVATHLDITDQKQHERQLIEQNIRFDAAINNMPQGLCMFDQDRRLDRVQPALCDHVPAGPGRDPPRHDAGRDCGAALEPRQRAQERR